MNTLYPLCCNVNMEIEKDKINVIKLMAQLKCQFDVNILWCITLKIKVFEKQLNERVGGIFGRNTLRWIKRIYIKMI